MYEKLQQFTWVDGVIAAGLALMTVGIGLNVKDKVDKNGMELKRSGPTVTVSVKVTSPPIKFEIAGEVLKPGVYQLPRGSRIEEGLMLSGGLALKADREWVERNINRAAVLVDGSKIYIPKMVEGGGSKTANRDDVTTKKVAAEGGENKIVNINTAAEDELTKLPGVGPSTAQKIISYREENGGFRATEEIKMVSGIGDKMFEKIMDLIEI